jgi:hypothetical protein
MGRIIVIDEQSGDQVGEDRVGSDRPLGYPRAATYGIEHVRSERPVRNDHDDVGGGAHRPDRRAARRVLGPVSAGR